MLNETIISLQRTNGNGMLMIASFPIKDINTNETCISLPLTKNDE